MSNAELKPVETVCRSGGEAVDEARGDAALVNGSEPSHGRVSVLNPREVPLGGLRAMNVRRTLPQRTRSLIGAWCFVDHYGPDDVAVSGGMNVPAHPHTGLQTVSWLFSGTIEHRDSAGNHAFVRPGELNLMTAGSGISHSERSTPDTTVLHGAQLWLALPDAVRDTDKRFDHYAPPLATGDGWTAQVFLGSLLGETSPVPMFSPLVGAELNLRPGAVLTLAVDRAFEHGVLVDRGEVSVQGIAVHAAHLGFVPEGSSELVLTAGSEGARLLLLGGAPFGEQIVMWWNFIGRSHEDIVRARAEWQAQIAASDFRVGDAAAGEQGAGEGAAALRSVDADRFGLPDGEPEPPLPAPPVPAARILPRRK